MLFRSDKVCHVSGRAGNADRILHESEKTAGDVLCGQKSGLIRGSLDEYCHIDTDPVQRRSRKGGG